MNDDWYHRRHEQSNESGAGMSVPYRRASQQGLQLLMLTFLGIGCSVALAIMLSGRMSQTGMFLVFVVPITASIVLGLIRMKRLRRKRFEAIQQMLERDSFIMDPKPPNDRKAAVFAPVAKLQGPLNLRNGSQGIQWAALHTEQPSSVCLFEHLHVTGSGKTTQEHFHTVIAFLTGVTGVEFASAFRAGWLQRRVLWRQGQRITTGDEVFDSKWVMLSDEPHAAALFDESVRLLLADSPKGESWHFGPTWVACAYNGAMDANNIERFRNRCENVLKHANFAEQHPSD